MTDFIRVFFLFFLFPFPHIPAMEQSQAKRRRDETYSNRAQFRAPTVGTDISSVKKSSSVTVSSIGTRMTPTQLHLPVKTHTSSTNNTLNKPVKVKRKLSDDDDSDFKEPPPPTVTKRITPSLNSFKSRNIFAATSTPRSGLVKPVVDDNSDFKRPPKLRLPKKNKAKDQTDHKKKQLLDTLQAYQKQQADDKDKKKCPFCSEVLFPLNRAIADGLGKIQKRDQEHKERELKLMEKENSSSSFGFQMIAKRQVSTEEKDAFCGLHYRELITKPEGYNKKYPTIINFEAIPKRIERFDTELRDIIRGRIASDYRNLAETAYEEQGMTKARSAMSVMLRFEHTLPGYYGPKGSSVIFDVLSNLYLKSGFLSKNLVSPQLPIEFIQQVLVPEAGFRLIRQDLIKAAADIPPECTVKAKQIMTESCDYGSAMFPMEEPEIDELDVDQTSCVLFEDNSDDENAYY